MSSEPEVAQRGRTRTAATQQVAAQATPVGFEPTRGDPIDLAGRRLSRSAKVSSVQLRTQESILRLTARWFLGLSDGLFSKLLWCGEHAGSAVLSDLSGDSSPVTVRTSTPVGFEPTWGDPIGLAGRRLSRSAEVSPEGPQATTAVHKVTVLQYWSGFGPQRRSATMDQ